MEESRLRDNVITIYNMHKYNCQAEVQHIIVINMYTYTRLHNNNSPDVRILSLTRTLSVVSEENLISPETWHLSN